MGKKKNIAELEKRLQEAEDTLDAIRLGHVDALVVQGPEGEQVFTLKGADHRYRLLVETMTEGALLVASDGTILYANSQFARLLDRPLETIIASRLDAHVAPAQVPFVNAVLGSAGGAAARVETQLLATDRSVPVYIAVTPGAGDAPKCVIVTDLSNQKHDQEILAAERLASQIVEQSTDGLVVCDANGHVIRASMPAQRLASGNPFLVPFAVAFPMYTSSDHQVGRTVVERALEGHKLSGHEVCLEHRGEALDLLLSAGPIANSDGAIVGCVISFIDNTERKRAAEERQSLLERADEARVEAENANRAKDEFLAMLGHELRNPLAPILTALEIMHMKGDSKTERERTMIERHVKDVVRLVGDLLDVSRIAQGKVEIERRAVDTAQLIAKAVEAAAPMIEEKGHHLSVDATPDIWIEADGSRISQVLSNLLTNAAKYTPRNGHISIRSIRDGDQIVISVSDDGMGVAPALLPRLFDLFVQGRRTIDRSDGGLGLGLAIVRNLVRMHGGTVVARSEGEGRGSTFEVRLPALAATYASQVVKFEDETEAEESGTRVLVVDDNRDAADLLGEALSTLGFRARIAYDGPSALDVAANFAPDIALLDIGLPVMDGYELARRLRSQVDGSGPLRLVALTGYGSASDRAKSAAAGFDAHMVKPINLTTLATTLKNLA